jgi:hypothetical protein
MQRDFILHTVLCEYVRDLLNFTYSGSFPSFSPEAEFLDAIGTKVFRVFLLAIHSHLY